MEHIALWEGKGDGSEESTWLEPVTDERYPAASAGLGNRP